MKCDINTKKLNEIIFNNISDAVFICNEMGEFHYICPSVANIFGYSASEIQTIGNINTLLAHDICNPALLLQEGEIRDIERDTVDKFGRIKHLLIFIKQVNIKAKAVLITCKDITERKETQEELERTNQKLRSHAIHLETVREEERKRIARQIHDDLGHSLTALKYELAWIEKNLKNNEKAIPKKFMELYDTIDMTINKVREICSELRPPVLDLFGVIEAIKWHSSEFQSRSGIKCRYQSDSDDLEVDDYFSTVVYRIYQEAMTNIVRHSKADCVDIEIINKGGVFMMKITDNGIGISHKLIDSPHSFGLISMREKAASLGGVLRISGSKDKGTSISLLMPLTINQVTK